MDRVSLLTRDGTSFHPVSQEEADKITSGPLFEPAVVVRGDTLRSQEVSDWSANRDFIFGKNKRPIAVWSDSRIASSA